MKMKKTICLLLLFVGCILMCIEGDSNASVFIIHYGLMIACFYLAGALSDLWKVGTDEDERA